MGNQHKSFAIQVNHISSVKPQEAGRCATSCHKNLQLLMLGQHIVLSISHDRAALNLVRARQKESYQECNYRRNNCIRSDGSLFLYMFTEHNERTSNYPRGKRRLSDQLQRKKAPTRVIITVILSIALHGEEADDAVYVMSVNVLSL